MPRTRKNPLFFTPLSNRTRYFYCSILLGQSFFSLKPFTPFKECDLVGLEKIEPVLNALSQTQTNALKELQKHSASLLFGDTGSGKTEIYMHSIAQTLEQKKRFIVSARNRPHPSNATTP